MATASLNQLLESLRSSLASGTYSDIRITCGSDTYKLHKVIVCNRAGFFARAVDFGGQETQRGTIDLPEDEPGVVKLLIQYLYEGEYEPQIPPADISLPTIGISTPVKPRKPVSKKSSSKKQAVYHLEFPHTCFPGNYGCDYRQLCPHHHCGQNCIFACKEFTCELCTAPAMTGDSSQLLTHSKMYQIGDKYEVMGLKELAKEKFDRCCKQFWDTLDFSIAANHAFSTTPEYDGGIRDLVSHTISEHMELLEAPEIRNLVIEYNGLALGILGVKSEELGRYRKSQEQLEE